MRISVRTKLFVAFGLAFAIMGTTALISLDNAARLAENAERLTQSHKLVAKLHAVVLALDAAETSQRVFVATGQARFLEPYDEAVRTALDSVASLERLTDGSSAHRVIIGVLEQQVHARLDELDTGIESRGPAIGTSGGVASTIAGGDTMTAIRGTVAALQATQDALNDGLEAALSRTGRANATVVVAMGVAAALLFIVAYTLSRGISNGVSAVAKAMRKIAEGDLSEEIRPTSSDEIGDMAVSYREMQAYLLQAADAATQIGEGDLDISAKPRSPRDTLGNAQAAMVHNLKQHAHAAELMASGDLSAEVVPLSDRDVLGNAFAHMIAKLRWMIGTLEETARERADALALAEMSAAALHRSNAELEQFAYIASHDLQEPLRKIRSFATRLEATQADAFDDAGRDYLARMTNAAARMQALIEDLLAYARVSSRGEAFQRVDLNRIAAEVIVDLEVAIEEAAAQVEIDDLPTADADPSQMRQLLQNLVSNAIKFRRPGESPVVRIRGLDGVADGDVREDNGETVRFAVEDDGIGFEPQYADRIFSVFQRLHGRTAYEGTGVGLAICMKIAQRHGGTITATGDPGRGARFVISMPKHHAEGGSADG
ncbi:MAG: CHASE3 domain-containing protein [Chloroflexi bacterium]|nr:CHASE3 domain-containing protein [Chloroflexota bacterium]